MNSNFQPVAGFNRTAAGRLIKAGFTYDGITYDPDPSFRLRGNETSMSDKEAILANVAENFDRTAVSPIDTALNMRRLENDHGITRKELGQAFGGITQTQVGNYFRLLELDETARSAVHKGLLGIASAINLLELPPEKAKEIVSEALSTGTKVKGATIATEIRESVLGTLAEAEVLETVADRQKDGKRPQRKVLPPKAEVKPEPDKTVAKKVAVKGASRTLADFKKFLMANSDRYAAYQDFYDFVQLQINWLNGAVTDKALIKAFDTVATLTVEAEESEVA